MTVAGSAAFQSTPLRLSPPSVTVIGSSCSRSAQQVKHLAGSELDGHGVLRRPFMKADERVELEARDRDLLAVPEDRAERAARLTAGAAKHDRVHRPAGHHREQEVVASITVPRPGAARVVLKPTRPAGSSDRRR